MKLGEKDIKETLRIQGGGKALFLDTEPAAKISVLAKGQSGFAQNVQVEGGISLRARDASSAKMTSRRQWSWFSIAQCLRTA